MLRIVKSSLNRSNPTKLNWYKPGGTREYYLWGMKIEIWSDIMCPFCYIGKRHFEKALEQFGHQDEIQIEWKSFQLDPDIDPKAPRENVYDHLAKRKGISREESVALHDRVVRMAKNAGLDYNFDKALVTNSFDAHRLIQLAKEYGKGDEMEEALFKAYFIEGKDLGEHSVLTELGKWMGLPEGEIERALTSDDYAFKVKEDIHEAAQIGVRAVPTFVFNRRYGISGAQPVQVFIETLEKAFKNS